MSAEERHLCPVCLREFVGRLCDSCVYGNLARRPNFDPAKLDDDHDYALAYELILNGNPRTAQEILSRLGQAIRHRHGRA